MPDSSTPVDESIRFPPVPAVARRRLVGVLVGVALGLTAVGFAAQVARARIEGRPELSRLLAPLLLGNEANIPTWYAGALLLLAALCAWLVAVAVRDAGLPHHRAWVALTVVLVAMSADEVGRVHETLNLLGAVVVDRMGWQDVAILAYPWVLPGAVVAVVVGAMFVPMLRDLPRPDMARLVAAGATFLLGALGLEVLGALQDDVAGFSWSRIIIQNLEELLEMVGVIILVDALLRLQCGAATRPPVAATAQFHETTA